MTFFETAARTMVYVSNADSREIYVLELNEKNGELKIIEKVAVTGNVMPLAISPNHKFLYASLRSEPFSVSSFAINPENGKLTLIKNTPLADNMAYLSTDRTGRYLFGASYSGNKISVNSIAKDGEINPQPLQIIPTGKNAHCILTDFSNKFLFVSTLGEDRLLQFKFDEKSGNLSTNEPPTVETKKGAGPRHFVFHPNHRLVFGNNELDGTVSVYRLDSSGTLQLLESTSIMPANSKEKPWSGDIRLTLNGKFLYASERTTSTITAFRVDDKNGKLTLIDNYPTELQPRGFNVSPDGKYLMVVGQKSNSLSVYQIDQKIGTLNRKFQIEVGKNPNWVEIVKLPK
ncbi:MAG TPA: beta-propeller fold lactonase family protein [Pyrinomonadaceae bacterium]|nr:beta-propeller fold lactonase family protein [Pyrinomonadaceae bacterium]